MNLAYAYSNTIKYQHIGQNELIYPRQMKVYKKNLVGFIFCDELIYMSVDDTISN
jgi:hypothetical protein